MPKFEKNKNYGVIPDPRSSIEKSKDWIAGSTYIVPKEILKPDGNWENYLPKKEVQRLNGFETFACVSFSFLNVLETLIKYQYGIEVNFSDRALAKLSKTDELGGNYYWNVFQTARQYGLIDEDLWSWKDLPKPITKESYYAPIPKEIVDKGLDFKNNWEIYWETIPNLDKEQFISSMKFWLKFSPLWVCIYNWQHAVMIYADAGNKAKVYDHYFQEKYEYDWGEVNFASILVLVKKVDVFVKTKNSNTIYLKTKGLFKTTLIPIKNPSTYWELAKSLLNITPKNGWQFKTISEEELKQYEITKPISI